MKDSILRVNKVYFEYKKDVLVLKDVNIDISLGEVIVLVGPNGSGKTTLMKLIFDLLKVQKGEILIAGNDNKDIGSKQKAIYLPSDNLLPEFLTGREYINLMCDMYDKACNYTMLNKLLEYYSMKDNVHNLIETYSHGMVKKIQLIAAFLIQPELIVIDETLNGIDIEAKEVTKLLMRQIASKDKAVLMCTHDLELAKEVGHRIIIMNEGCVHMDIDRCNLGENTNLTDILRNIVDFEDDAYEI